MKKIALCLVLVLAPIPAIGGHEKAPDRLGIPWVVGHYLHKFGGMHSTLIRLCPPMTPCKALVAFYDTEEENESSWVGTATFAINGDGSLGRMLIFRFPDGAPWVYEANEPAPRWGEYQSQTQ